MFHDSGYHAPYGSASPDPKGAGAFATRRLMKSFFLLQDMPCVHEPRVGVRFMAARPPLSVDGILLTSVANPCTACQAWFKPTPQARGDYLAGLFGGLSRESV